jgi:hypothetical protein
VCSEYREKLTSVSFVARGVFSRTDRANGVQLARETDGAELLVAVTLPDGLAYFRLESDGGVTYWGLPRD